MTPNPVSTPGRRWFLASTVRGAGAVALGWLNPALAQAGGGLSTEEAKTALRRATEYLRSISTHGGFLWSYSADLKERRGEVAATASQVWIQPPGTPSVGAAFLNAFRATRDPFYLEAAEDAAYALAQGQLASGGWDYLIDFDPVEGRKWLRRTDPAPAADADRRRNVTTFDDDNTQSAVRFLLEFVDAARGSSPRRREIRESLDYALKKMLAAQYPNGAWPQRWEGKPRRAEDYPVVGAKIPTNYPREYQREDYRGHYTLNDNTQRDCIATILLAHRRFGERKYRDAARRGGDFLILAQLPTPQPTWAQQYNRQMEPAWARAFEPPSVCSSESVGAIRTLLDLYSETRDGKYLKPIPPALEWFRRSEIAPNTWARLYELGTNRPIYGDRDGKIHYTLEELTEERRRGYSWRGPYGVRRVMEEFEAVQAGKSRRPAMPVPAAAELEAAARRAMAGLDDKGRWITAGRIEMRTALRELEAIISYLRATP
jgi:hypothetical protein